MKTSPRLAQTVVRTLLGLAFVRVRHRRLAGSLAALGLAYRGAYRQVPAARVRPAPWTTGQTT